MMTRSTLSPETLTEIYMRGECHIHAIAARDLHGGGFAIAYDDSEIYFESDNGEESVSSVIHVWSVHETDRGLIARDVLGDIPFTKDAMVAHLENFFPDMAEKFEFGDAWIDMQGTLEEIEELSGDGEHQPLTGIDRNLLTETLKLESVMETPGGRLIELSSETSGLDL